MESTFDPNASPLSFLQDELLPQLRPDTTDSDYLDRLSTEQLVDFTYREHARVDEVGDGNCLVPEDVGGFDDAMFRNPPAHRVKMLISRDSLGNTISLSFDGFAGTQLDINTNSLNRYNLSESDIPSVQIEGEEYSLYTAEQPFRTTARPVKFTISDDGIPLKLDEEYQQHVVLEGHSEPIARFNPQTGTTETRELRATGDPTDTLADVPGQSAELTHHQPELHLQFSVTISEDAALLETAGLQDEYVCLTVTVRNRTPVDEDDEEAWAEGRIFYPSLEVDLENIQVRFPTQQHDTKLTAAREDPDNTASVTGENLYRQQDCILTRTVGDFEDRWADREQDRGGTFRTTSFGIYDYIEEDPVDAQFTIAELIQMDDAELVDAAPQLANRRDELLSHDSLLHSLRGVLLTLRHYLSDDIPRLDSEEYSVGDYDMTEPRLHKFQWDALQKRAAGLLDDDTHPVVVQAPTSAGKTLVYYGSTLLSIFERGTRAAFPFPTRMLTEDKLEEVIDLAHAYNTQVKGDAAPDPIYAGLEKEFSVGVVLGQQESSYEDSKYLHAEDLTEYIGECHECGGDLGTECQDCQSSYCNNWQDTHLHFVKCTNDFCNFTYDFVYDVKRTSQYLPSLTVGTPEKFFTMPTVETGTHHSTFSTLPFYGAPYRECEDCGRALSDMNIYSVASGSGSLTCLVCLRNSRIENSYHSNEIEWTVREPYSETAEHDPIGHIVLDETHMYTGHFGITISVIIRFFEVLASRLRSGESRDRDVHDISADSGTATISNKLEHLSRLLRTPTDEIAAVPERGEHSQYFNVYRDSVRYRVLSSVPVATSNRGSFREAVVQAYDDFHSSTGDTTFRSEFSEILRNTDADVSIADYELILGYLHRRSDGYALQEAIGDRAEQISDGGLSGLQFISGDSSKSHMRSHMGMGTTEPDPVVLANLVVSLGIDIPELNNLLLYGAPRSMSEQMQTIGRTGRQNAAGHASIHLYPGKPRDMQIERKFHQILGNVADYYDRAAIHSSNPHIADILFDYVIGPFITLEFAIGEQYTDVDNLHILQDLKKMFDDGPPPTQNLHTKALYYDMAEIFCPDHLDLDQKIINVIEDKLTERLFHYVGTEEDYSIWFEPATQASAEGNPVNINQWFKETLGDLELRGESDVRIELETEYKTPSEVDL